MEEQMLLKEILHALKVHGEHIDEKFDSMKSDMDKRFDSMKSDMDKRFDNVEKRFERVDKKFDKTQEELIDLRETTNFLLSKLIQHDKKLQQLSK